MISRRAGSVVVVVACAMLGLGACGGSAKKVDPVADLARREGRGLTSADLPGCTSTPYKPSDDLPAAAKKDSAPDRAFETGLAQKVYDRVGTKAK